MLHIWLIVSWMYVNCHYIRWMRKWDLMAWLKSWTGHSYLTIRWSDHLKTGQKSQTFRFQVLVIKMVTVVELKISALISCEIQWGSENRTCPVFKWLKSVRSWNGSVFKWFWTKLRPKWYKPRPFLVYIKLSFYLKRSSLMVPFKNRTKMSGFRMVIAIWISEVKMSSFWIPTVRRLYIPKIVKFDGRRSRSILKIRHFRR